MAEVRQLLVGYAYEGGDGKFHSSASVTLIHSEGNVILVDTGSPWEKDKLLHGMILKKVFFVVVAFVISIPTSITSP